MPPNNYCLQCGARLVDKPHEGPARRAVRKYCGHKCAGLNHPRYKIPIEVRFMEKVDKRHDSGCWVWVGAQFLAAPKDKRGVFNLNRSRVLAHRAACILFKGHIPSGMAVRHTCDNGLCVNPDHLLIGTQKDNIDDMARRGRRNDLKGTERWTAKLTEADVVEIRRQKPFCTSKVLAEKFGVAQVTINDIIHRKKWKHVP